MKKLALGLLLGSFALISLSASAQATRTWVSGVGDDANPCSRTAPCKTFAGAISKTAASGEIDTLDPGGFGAVTITKAITIDGGPNAGGISVAAGNGINISALPTDEVTIRNLNIECLGPTTSCTGGITVSSAKAVHVQHVDIGGNFTNGINVTSAMGTTLFVDGVTVHEINGNGINFSPGVASYASVTNSLFENNQNGISANGFSKLTVSNSTAAGNSGVGFLANADTASATINAFNCNASFNTTAGYSALAPGTAAAVLRLSGDSATSNGAAVSSSGTAATVVTFQNNPLSGGTTTLTPGGLQ